MHLVSETLILRMVCWILPFLWEVLQYTRAVKPSLQYEPKPAHTRHRLSRLGLASLTTLGLAGEDLLTILVELELADNDVGGVDGDGDGLAVGLLADDTLKKRKDGVSSQFSGDFGRW